MARYLNWNHGEVKMRADGTPMEIDPIQYWDDAEVVRTMPSIAYLAKFVVSCPASSAPVERLFSHGGIIFRPHRRQLRSENLSKLMLLKANRLDMSV